MKNAILVQANISAGQTEIIKYIVKQIVKFTKAEVIDFYKGSKLINMLDGVETVNIYLTKTIGVMKPKI